jgi:nucleoside-diphosphate-sugar epimerase
MDNVVGTHNLLEAIKEINKNIFLLHFSTDEVYGETTNDMIKTYTLSFVYFMYSIIINIQIIYICALRFKDKVS